jgi:hypothetical protein
VFADLAPTVSIAGRSLNLIKRPRARIVNGRKRAQPPHPPVCITGSLQNPRERELQELPELQRTEGIKSLYVTQRLCLGDIGDEFESDHIEDPATELVYEVFAERDWGSEGAYYRYLLREVGQ